MTRIDWERVAPLLERLLEIPEPRRESWLAAECGHETTLFRRVWSALESATRADEFLASPLDAPERSDESPRVEPDGGRRIGPYQLERVLGSGGMGQVWLARRVDGQYQQSVALKLIKRGMDTEAVVRRFHQERQVLADLEHPRVARLLDGGTTEEGLPYLVMEHVEGRPLLAYCDAEGLDVERRLRLFQKICSTVHFAHENQVVHRDLKPSNVLVAEDGEPKLLDFGIAKVIEAGDEATAELTRTGERLLSPRYASPEQLRGERVGPASDVYALGVILFELLVARHPHGWLTTSWREFELEVLEREAPRPSRAILSPTEGAAPLEGRRARSRRLRGDLDTITETALCKDPERRYASARALSADIGLHLAGRPIHARPDTLVYRVSKYVRRNRGPVLGAGAFVLLLLVALTVSLSLYEGSLRSASEARWEAYVGRVGAAKNALESLHVADAREHLRSAPEDHRGWEWRHLQARLDRARRTLDGIGVGALCLDAERGRLAVARDSRIEILDIETLTPLFAAFGAARSSKSWKGCTRLSFSRDGRSLASVWGDGGLFMHDLTHEGRVLFEGDETATFTSAAFHPRASRLVVGREDGSVLELDPVSGATKAEHQAHTGPVTDLAFDSEGRRLASGSWDGAVRLWDADGLTPEHTLEGHTMGVNSVAFAPDGARLVSCSLDGTARVWDAATGASLLVEALGGGFVSASRFDPGGGRILSALRGGIVVWDATTRGRLATWLGHEDPPLALAVDPLRNRVWSVDGHSLKEWSLSTEDVRTFPACEYSDAVCFDPKGGRFANGGPDGRIRLWSWPGGEPLGVLEVVLEGGPAKVLGLAFDPHEDRLFTLEQDGHLALWDPSAGRLLRRGEPAEHPGTDADVDLDIDASGEHLLCSLTSRIELREASSGRLLRFFEAPDGKGVLGARFDPAGRRVAAGTTRGTLVWDAGSGALLAELDSSPPRSAGVRVVAFHPHEDLLASGLGDGTLLLWAASARRCLAELSAAPSPIVSLVFSPDGRRLAAGLQDGSIRLWDVPSRRVVATLIGHQSYVSSMAFSPDGEALLSCSYDASVRLWETEPTPAR